MPQQLMSYLCLALGLLAIGMGAQSARARLRMARRSHQRVNRIYAAMPEGWGSWFLQGFSELTVGTQWLTTAIFLTFWTLMGVVFISVGIRGLL